MKCIPCPCDATMDRIKTDTRTPVIYYVTVCFRHSNLEIKIKYTDIQFYPICFIEKGRILSSCPSRFRFGTIPCCLMVVQLPSWGKNKCRALGVGTHFFCGGCSRWIHKKCSGISGTLKPQVSFICKRCTGLVMSVDGIPKTEITVGSLRWYHSSAYPQVSVVNSHPPQDAVSHGTNSMSSCPSWPPNHFPSPPEEEFL